MSRKEARRPGLVKLAVAGKITTAAGARSLEMSLRQFRRLKARYRAEGVRGLLHRRRGQPSGRGLDVEIHDRVVALIQTTYRDFNDCHGTEKLQAVEGLPVSRSTVRRRRPRQHRARRPRHPTRGSLVLVDGSEFDWLGTGSRCSSAANSRPISGVASSPTGRPSTHSTAQTPAQRETSLQAFGRIAEVLRHPRCLNCHPSGDFPRRADDRHRMLVARGPDDRGTPALTCSTCHQTENTADGRVPGAPHWQLAPRTVGWEGLSDADLCRVLKDSRKNKGRSVPTLVEHMTTDPLVQWAWRPGERTPPSIGQREFHELVRWAQTGVAFIGAGGVRARGG